VLKFAPRKKTGELSRFMSGGIATIQSKEPLGASPVRFAISS
jgi:hypothetical protein